MLFWTFTIISIILFIVWHVIGCAFYFVDGDGYKESKEITVWYKWFIWHALHGFIILFIGTIVYIWRLKFSEKSFSEWIKEGK